MERRLSAILAVDVVGYSRLIEQDEADTFERLRAHRKDLFEPEIATHHGRIFKLTGDGLLAEFGSVVDAVECAVLLQRAMAERNNGLPDGQRIDVRMGINLGDVIVEDDDRHGEGVVIAARLQQLAEPGGIAVSGTVADHVKHRLPVDFDLIGEERLKNIAEPVRVLRVSADPVCPAKARSFVGRKPKNWAMAAAALLLIGAGIAAAVYGIPDVNTPRATTSDQGIPTIVILPFEDLTGTASGSGAIDIEKVGRGIAEEFITDLSTFPQYQVVSSATSSALAGKSIPEIVAATGATFVIEGSIRAAGDKATITMQLIDGKSDRHLKIAQIEESMADPVGLQRTVAAELRDGLGGMSGVLRDELNRIAESKQEADLTEYDYYLLGHIHLRRGWKSEISRALEIWAKGLVRFPESVLLRCQRVFVEVSYGNYSEARRYAVEATAGRRKSRMDEWCIHYAQARTLAYTADQKQAGVEARLVLEMTPYDTMAHVDLAHVLRIAGLLDDAIEAVTFGITHDPTPQKWYFDNLLSVYRGAGRLKELAVLAESQMRQKPRYAKWWCGVLGVAQHATGQIEDSKATWKICAGLPEPPML
jgi:class 3 adenylate cyclase/TolB-like protein